MHLNKIQRAVNKSASTYMQHHRLQYDVCQLLIQRLIQHQSAFGTVADMACGVGASTQQLIQAVHAERYIAADLSSDALQLAKQQLPAYVDMINADFHTKLVFNLDLVFCNMGLHWSIDLEQAMKAITASLNPQGLFAFSLPVVGTFHELKPDHRLALTDMASILYLLHQLGLVSLTVDTYIKTFHFTHSMAAIQSLKYTGSNVNFNSKIKHLHTKQHIDNYFVDKNKCHLTYQIALFVARKR